MSRLVPLLLLFALAVAGGCDTQGQQKDFIDEAFSVPEGFVETTRSGEIVSEDRDDWRSSPVYQNIVLVDPAYPNPPNGEFVTVPVQVREFDSVPGGLKIGSFDETNRFVTLDEVTQARDPGRYVFSFNPVRLGRTGLVRIYILDGLDELVSYGDLSL